LTDETEMIGAAGRLDQVAKAAALHQHRLANQLGSGIFLDEDASGFDVDVELGVAVRSVNAALRLRLGERDGFGCGRW
jgi:hypothetical protein